MSAFRWSLTGFFCLVVALAGGGLWYLLQEDNLREPLVVEDLVWEATPPVASEFLPSQMPVEEVWAEPEVVPEKPFEWPEGSVEGEVVFSFGSRTEMEAFMREARRAGLRDLDSISGLRMVRVRVGNDDDLRRALGLAGDARMELNPFVEAPDVPPMSGMAAGYLSFGDQALAWMGVPDNNSHWGAGVRIAVLDTGVGPHPSLDKASIAHLSMLNDGRGVDVGSHGTAVASLLVGQGEVRGIAPAADLLSIQVLDGEGVGNGFDLARGIMAAVDAGAQIVNMSLGTSTHSMALWEAVQYGQSRGVVFVASAGNDGSGQLLFPAAYAGVFSVASVDANGQHLPFSNRGENLALAAPGFGLKTAAPDGGVMFSNGTSFSGPLAAGAIASLIPGMSSGEAMRVMMDYANDAGPPGPDGYHGSGILNMERIEWRNTPGIYDLAVAGHYLDFSNGAPEMLVTVQNRGTEPVGNVSLEVTVNGQVQIIPIGLLPKAEVAAGTISLGNLLDTADSLEVVSRVTAPGVTDIRPDNDLKASLILVRPPDE